MKTIDKGVRFTNYIIDMSIIVTLWIVLSIVLQHAFLRVELYYLLTFFYYFLLESTISQTIGKLVTKTKVTHKNGGKSTIVHILVRSFIRLIPIDGFSYLFGSEYGLHDVLSSTKLVKR